MVTNNAKVQTTTPVYNNYVVLRGINKACLHYFYYFAPFFKTNG
jgi:hypothetical protein